MRKYEFIVLTAAMAFLCLSLSSCKYGKKENSSTSGTTTIVCDNTFENIMEQEIRVFEYQYPDAHILPYYVPQNVAVDSLLNDKTRTAVLARDITKAEREALKKKKRTARSSLIAVDAIAFIVNHANPLNKLTLAELATIVSGEVKEWNDLWPTDLGRINVVVDDAGSSMATFLRDSLLDGGRLGPNVVSAGSIPEVFNIVEKDKGAIGVLGVSWITSDLDSADVAPEELAKAVTSEEPVQGVGLTQRVKVMGVMRNDDVVAYKPYQKNIFDGTYPLYRHIYMITTAHSGSVAGGFYSFVTGDIGQKIILKTGICPARVNIQVVELVK